MAEPDLGGLERPDAHQDAENVSPRSSDAPLDKPRHDWLRRVNAAFVPGPMTPLLEQAAGGLMSAFSDLGHTVQERPDEHTDILFTTAHFDRPLHWREALLFSARRRFGLSRLPTIFTLVHARPAGIEALLARLGQAVAKEQADPADYDFPGLSPQAYHVLFEQGRRGGAILALERLLQSYVKGLRILALVGEEQPDYGYLFDLVGAHPKLDGSDQQALLRDVALRTVTILSTFDVTQHLVQGEPIPPDTWRGLAAPAGMCRAARELGRRNFFTEMIRIADLVSVPAVGDAVASQYSEGCFATWEPGLSALVATVTGSARPVDKANITEDDLAVIVGVREDGLGALVRRVQGKANSAPSSEAVEMAGMDGLLPTVALGQEWGAGARVPVARSKLHGHRGVSAYDPARVEYTPLDEPYYHYPVCCGTSAQARAIRDAFSRSEALRNPDDPRQLVFTVLPGHGAMVVEKWAAGKAPLQLMWEHMDAGHLRVDSYVPQGMMRYVSGPDGMMVLREG